MRGVVGDPGLAARVAASGRRRCRLHPSRFFADPRRGPRYRSVGILLCFVRWVTCPPRSVRQNIFASPHIRSRVGAGRCRSAGVAPNPRERGPIVGSTITRNQRNVIGTHWARQRSIARWRWLRALCCGPSPRPDRPGAGRPIGPYPQWVEPSAIVSIDPFGAVSGAFRKIRGGLRHPPHHRGDEGAHPLPELDGAAAGRLSVDGRILLASGSMVVTKAAIEPGWWLPEIAERFGVSETHLRRTLFEETAGMFPELVTRRPRGVPAPIGGRTSTCSAMRRSCRSRPSADRAGARRVQWLGRVRVGHLHLPALSHARDRGVLRGARQGGAGVIVYSRKEGRALGEVTKFLVYNARKRQKGGDSAALFPAHRMRGGSAGLRFQELMPICCTGWASRAIDRLVSMSNMKYDAMAWWDRDRRTRGFRTI